MSFYYEIPVIIPAYEPDDKLIGLLERLLKAGIQRIIVVDDGSGNAYSGLFDKAGEMGCVVLRHALNLGKGRALKTAFNECLIRFADAPGCICADSDGQHTTEDILRCIHKLLECPDELVLGCRDFDASDVPGRSSFGNKCTRQVFRYLLGISVSDTQTGLRAIPASFMKKLMEVKGERFEYETNMLIETKNLQIPIVEVPIKTIYLEENKMSHFHPIKDSIRIYLLFGKFLFSSLSSSVLDLLLFALFCRMFKSGAAYTGVFSGVPYIVTSTVAARVLSAIYNFLVNYKVVFKSNAGIAKAAFRYFLLALFQMFCSAFLVNGLHGFFGGSEVMLKVPVDVFLFFASFVIQREFVYRKKSAG